MDDHDEGRDDVQDVVGGMGYILGTSWPQSLLQGMGPPRERTSGQVRQGDGYCQTSRPKRGCSRRLLFPCGHAENWWPHSTAPPLSCKSGPK